jgi:hypothetical protein
MDRSNIISTQIFANTEQVKASLLAFLERKKHNLENSLGSLTTQRDRNQEIALYEGFKQGIEYAIDAIEAFENTPEEHKKCQ